ncbi:MAG: nucleotidyltransferase domain-containing protein [Paramuribaculum sp.]|nr:nucleotidyltransferase domain-containing protein [Paramuribaculum sp.]MDE6310326.1 nucleotidyltransferase domain-containing protein [Muribaculaceae bacterium]
MSEKEKFAALVDALSKKAAEILPKGSQVALYGSRTRGDARPVSDWDVHILVPGEEKLPLDLWDKYAWPLEEVGWAFDAFVSPRLYSFAGWLKRSFLPFYKNVEQDKIIIFQN